MYPNLFYSVIVWGGVSQNSIAPLFILEKRIFRMIANCHYLFHTNPLFLRFNILVSDICEFVVSQHVFQHQEIFTATHENNYSIIARSNIVPVFQRLSVTRKSIYFRVHMYGTLYHYILGSPGVWQYFKSWLGNTWLISAHYFLMSCLFVLFNVLFPLLIEC